MYLTQITNNLIFRSIYMIMSKKIRITENQLQMLLKNKGKQVEEMTTERIYEDKPKEEECDECWGKSETKEEDTSEVKEMNTMPDSNPISDPMMNESIRKIRENFKRFFQFKIHQNKKYDKNWVIEVGSEE